MTPPLVIPPYLKEAPLIGLIGMGGGATARHFYTASSDEDYQVGKSLRFDDARQGQLAQKLHAKGNKRKFTVATWLKRHETGESYIIQMTDDPVNAVGTLRFRSDNTLEFCSNASDYIRSTQAFKHTGAWMHVVGVFDSDNDVAGERIRLYLNGKRLEGSQSNPSENETFVTTSNTKMNRYVGSGYDPSQTFDGYLAETYYIDGLALDPGAFGKFNSLGVWDPKTFAITQPNSGVTWSDYLKDTDGGGPTLTDGASYPLSNCFDGKHDTVGAMTYANGMVFTPPSPITFSSSVEVFVNSSVGVGAQGYIATISGEVQTLVSLNDGAWATIYNGSGTLDKLVITRDAGGGNNNLWINGLRIDGVTLIDGQTDSTSRTSGLNSWPGPNNGTLWSDYLTGTGGSLPTSGGQATNKGFDGSISTYCQSNGGTNPNSITFTPPGGMAYTNKVEVMTVNAANTCSVNGGTAQSLSADVWNTVATGSGTISTIVFSRPSSNGSSFIGIKVDGVVLIDGAKDNSFHLTYADNTVEQSLGKDTLNGAIADATGGLPIYNTSDDYGDVKGTGYRTDSSAGTTDGTGLIFALTGDTLTDVHADINTGSSANTLSLQGHANTWTTRSRFYGSSWQLDGTGDYIQCGSNSDYAFGTGDFCIEFWWYQNDTSAGSTQSGVAQCSDTAGGLTSTFTNGWALTTGLDADGTTNAYGLRFKFGDGTHVGTKAGGNTDDDSYRIKIKQWQHIAITRSSGTARFFIDGLMVDEESNTYNMTSTNLAIGGYHSTSYLLNGNLNDFRIYKGVAKYTSNFTTPSRQRFVVSNIQEADRTIPVGTSVTITGWDDQHENIMDGDPSTSCNGYNGGIVGTVTFSPAIPNVTKVRLYSQPYKHYLNGTDVSSTAGTTMGDPGWYTLYDDSSTAINLTSVGNGYFNETQSVDLRAIEVNGKILKWGSEFKCDSLTDTPTNYGDDSYSGAEVRGNYCVWNLLDKTLPSPANGGLNSGTAETAGWRGMRGTFPLTTGKWYFEAKLRGMTSDQSNGYYIGVGTKDCAYNSVNQTGQYTRQTTTTVQNGTYNHTDFTVPAVNEIHGIAVDMDAKKMWISTDGTWEKSGDPANGSNPHITINSSHNELFPFVQIYGSTINMDCNFGQRAWERTCPSGFKALCTHNLSDTFGANNNASEDKNKPSKYFDTKLYEGTGADQEVKMGFQPDLLWIKNRTDNSTAHIWQDVIQGIDYGLHINNSQQQSGWDGVVTDSFNSDGFTASSHSYSGAAGKKYVSWTWDAGTSAATVSDSGDITPSAEWVNTAAGFSIIKNGGNGSNDQSIGHGLGAAPDFIITKRLSGSSEHWCVRHKNLTGSPWDDVHMHLDHTDGQDGTRNVGTGSPTSTLFYVGSDGLTNENGAWYMHYLWATVAGYSRFDTYDGGDANKFVYCGFKPKLIILKNSSNDGESWFMFDSVRGSLGTVGWSGAIGNEYLGADTTLGGYTNGNTVTFHSNGFSLVGTGNDSNGSGRSYIFAAWAEHPFKVSRAG